MPIPHFLQEEESSSTKAVSSSLSLVLLTNKEPVANAPVGERVAAHLLDLSLVAGISFQVAKVSSLLLATAHAEEIQNSGRLADGIFRAAWSYGHGFLVPVTFLCLYFLYFTAVPFLLGRTMGMGLMGLKITSIEGVGEKLSLRALWKRAVACFFTYPSLGVFSLIRSSSGALFQDHTSGTRVERS